MMTYTELRGDGRKFLALTGLTPREFELLLGGFARSWQRRYPATRTAAGRPRQRYPGGGRKGVLDEPEQKLLFLLVYLKTYPLQVLLGELFDLSQPAVNYWLRRLLPILRDALDDLGVLPERDPRAFGRAGPPRGRGPRLIIDGTERRRQRPKNPEKQAAHYSGRKKTHSDQNVVVVEAGSKHVGFLSRTYVGRAADKGIADREGIAYPPGTVLYKDSAFQGYEPPVAKTCQAKKKAARWGVDRGGEAHQPEVGAHPGAGGARVGGREALPHREGRVAGHGRRCFGFGHGGSLWVTQPPGPGTQAATANLTKPLFLIMSIDEVIRSPIDKVELQARIEVLLRARRQAVALRQAGERALRQSEERLGLMIEGVQDYALFLIDPNGDISECHCVKPHHPVRARLGVVPRGAVA